MKFEWEEIYFSDNYYENVYMETSRAKVIGGWLVRHQMLVDEDRENEFEGWTNSQNTMVFIPDPNHEWDVE